MNGKIVQIMKCEEDFKAVYVGEDKKLYSDPVIAWGLTEDGEVVPLTVELSEGVLDDARTENFIGILPSDYRMHWNKLNENDELIASVIFPGLAEKLLKEKSHQISCNLSNGKN